MSVICLFSCLLTLLTFFLDVRKLPYPERPIIYVTICFMFIAVILLAGYGFDDDVVCNKPVENQSMNFVTEKTVKQVTFP